MLRRPARYLNERVAGDGEFSPVSVPAGILGINACATSGGSLRDTANPNALSIKKVAIQLQLVGVQHQKKR